MKMKVGILSMQQIKNYGSFLQAFSLKKNIELLGHSCEFINIVPGQQLEGYKKGKFDSLITLIKRLWGWDFYKRFKYTYRFQKRFDKEFLPYLGVKDEGQNDHFDVAVIGSDEVFNCAQKTWWGFSKQLFGEGLNADKVISYAGSFGATTLDKLDSFKLRESVYNSMKGMSSISVRDRNSYDVVSGLLGVEPSLNVDPVFIFNYDEYMPKSVELKDYIIVYTYPGRIKEKEEITYIRKFAEEKNMKLVSIGHYFPWCDMTITPTPFEVLAYFRGANYIITDTFHGSIFSIKYNRPFCTIVRDMNSQKLSYLLEQFGLKDRIVSSAKNISSMMKVDIDYTSVNSIINSEKMKSITYLKANL